MNRNLSSVAGYSNNILSRGFWEWTLFILIVGSLSVSYIEGLSKYVILYGALYSGIFFIFLLYHKISLKLPTEIIIYFFWVIWSLGGLVNVIDSTQYFSQLKTIIQIFILIFLTAMTISLYRNIAVIMLSIGIGGIIVGVSSVISGEFQQSLELGERATGLAGNANEFAYLLLFVIISMFYFLNPQSPLRLRWRIMSAMIIFVSFVFIVFSGSRKGLLGGLAFIFLWWFFCQSKKISKTQIKGYMILLLVLGGIYYSANAVMSSAAMGRRLQNIDDSSNRLRVQMYLDGFEIIKKYPFFGIGLDNYRVLSSSGLYSHSDYIETAANTGIIGFILYFSIYLVLWLRLSRLKAMINDPRLLYIIGLLKAVIITVLLIAFGRPNITSKVTWIFLAAAIGYSWSIKNIMTNMKLYRNNHYIKILGR